MRKRDFKKIIALMLATILLSSVFTVSAEKSEIYKEIYVDAQNGSDKNSGTKDSPYKSFEKAVEAVKKVSRKMTGDIVVYFADGRYELSDTIKLQMYAGGKDDYKVIYKAADGAKPIISGGEKIENWEVYDEEKNIYRAKAHGLYSRHFTVDGELATRARTEGGLNDVALDYGKLGFTCSNMEFADIRNKENVEAVFTQTFYMHRRLFKDIYKKDENTVQFVTTDKYKGKRTGVTSWTKPKWIENVFEYLDEEGEFYIDNKEDYVYYKPKAGQNMDEVCAVIPVLEELISVGGYNYHERTKNVVFDGLTFSDTTWMFITEDGGLCQLQDAYLYNSTGGSASTTVYDTYVNPAAIALEKAVGIEILNCEFTGLGASAVRALKGTQDLRIEGNHMHDVAGGAVYIGTVTRSEENPEDTRRIIKDVLIKNNYIHHVATEQWGAAAVSVGYPMNCTISHNEIHDVPYSGAHIGWGWGSVRNKTLLNFVFEYNYVHDFMQHMGDGGGIYTLGYTSATPENPNKIVKNYFKDCWSHHLMAGGMIYLDNTSSNWLIEENVIDNIEGSKVWDGKPFAMTTYTPKNDYWHRNYHTTVYTPVNDLNRNIIFEDNQHHPAANWPEEARDTIAKSGLEPEYRHLSPRSNEFSKIFTSEYVRLNEGETYKMETHTTNEFCEEVKVENATVSYELKDETIATIDENGLITAHKNGRTEIMTTLKTADGIIKTAPTTVIVGSGLAKVVLETKTPHKLVKGEVKQIPILKGLNHGGEEIDGALKNITFKSSDESVVSVDVKANRVVAENYGEATITFTAEYDGVTKSGEHKITVIDYAGEEGLDHPVTSMEELLANAENWHALSGNIHEISGGLAFEETTTVQYSKETFGDEIFDFYMSLTKQATWPSITLRNQAANKGIKEDNSFYIIGFAKNGIEVQRFNGNDRTVIYATLLPETRIGNIHPMILEAGRKYHVQIGTINEENGVRIILNIDGKNIINYLDDAEGRIEKDGYMGLMIQGTTMNITSR